jgi:hypothetical protein
VSKVLIQFFDLATHSHQQYVPIWILCHILASAHYPGIHTLSWHPHIVTMPGPTRDDMLLAAIQDLTVAVEAYSATPTHPSTELQPFSAIRVQMSENLKKLNSIFSEPHSSTTGTTTDTEQPADSSTVVPPPPPHTSAPPLPLITQSPAPAQALHTHVEDRGCLDDRGVPRTESAHHWRHQCHAAPARGTANHRPVSLTSHGLYSITYAQQ